MMIMKFVVASLAARAMAVSSAVVEVVSVVDIRSFLLVDLEKNICLLL